MLDLQLIDLVRKMCLRIIEKHGEITLAALTDEIAARGFQHLSQASVQEVLSTLVLDGQVAAPLRLQLYIVAGITGGRVTALAKFACVAVLSIPVDCRHCYLHSQSPGGRCVQQEHAL